ncbi:MAG: exopolysaccharide biosynthesis polyprenyl glycosylphosphotransferase [Trueperaceae bacterium]
MLSSDLGSLLAAAVLASTFWHVVQPLADRWPQAEVWPFGFLVPFGFAFMGLYPAAGVSVVQEFRRSSMFITVTFGTAVSALFLSGEIAGASRGFFVLAWLFSVALVPMARGVARHLFARAPWWGIPAIVLGAGRTAELIVRGVETHPGLDIKILACLDDDRSKHGTNVGDVPVVGPLEDAATLQRRYRALYGIVAMPGLAPQRLTSLLQQYARVFPHVVVIPNVFGMSSVGVGTRDFVGVVGLYDKQNLLMPHNRVAKRLLDLLLLVPLGVAGLPVVALGALAVFLVDRGNPFYAQVREGYRGKPIRVWKLRTMRRDADAYLERYLEEHPEARDEWGRHFKLTRDPRILPLVGEILRRSSLDELPQLWNIVLGQMSFVGPRPFPYYHLEQFEGEFRQLRTSVVPGLTGYWQVTSRSTADLEAQVALDSYYIRNWSVWMDLYIVARTPWAVVFGKGAY